MTQRDRTVIMVVGMLVIVGAFWFLLIGPRHKKYTAAVSAANTAQSRKSAAEESVAKAAVAKKNYPGNYSQVAQLGKAVPVEDEVPSLVYQLSHTSDSDNIDFRSIDLDSTAAGATGATAPAAVAAPAPTSTTSTTDTTSTSTTPAAGATGSTPATATSVAASTLPPGAAIGAAGFPTMPFTFKFDGSFFDMSSFLQDIDRYVVSNSKTLAVRGRLLSIDGIVLSASRDGFPAVQAAINATAFLLPSDEGLTNGATPAAPSTAAAATPGTASATPAPAAAGANR